MVLGFRQTSLTARHGSQEGRHRPVLRLERLHAGRCFFVMSAQFGEQPSLARRPRLLVAADQDRTNPALQLSAISVIFEQSTAGRPANHW